MIAVFWHICVSIRFCFGEHLESYAREISIMHLGVHEKFLQVLLVFKHIWNESWDFNMHDTHPVTWNCFQQFSIYCMKRDGEKFIKEPKDTRL